jgi:hypothetical protein
MLILDPRRFQENKSQEQNMDISITMKFYHKDALDHDQGQICIETKCSIELERKSNQYKVKRNIIIGKSS